jgi:hypothetical protein
MMAMTGYSATARVQELELELSNLREAFEEYIESSRELESGLDRELIDMRTYLIEQLISLLYDGKLT